jgi:hypothetical protein
MMSNNHTAGHQSGHLAGCDDLRAWLQSQDFTCERQPVPDRDNLANWHAYRVWNSPSTPQHTVQVRPFKVQLGHRQLEMADVAVVREVDGVAYELKAYSLGFDVLREKLDDIAQQLVQACWLIENSSSPADRSENAADGPGIARGMRHVLES